MKKSLLLLLASMLMAVTSAFAEWTKPALPQGLSIENADGNDVYFVNVETGKFFNGMKTIHDWNTTGGVDVYGLKMEFYEFGHLYNCNDRNRMIFRNSITELHVDHLTTTAGGTWGDTEDGSFDFKVNGSYVRICTQSDNRGYTDYGTRFWGVIPSQHPSHVYPNADPAVAGNFCDWIIITPETYAVYQPKVLHYYTAVELGETLANIKKNYPEIKVSSEQAVYDNEQSTTEQLRAAIMSLTAKLKRPTVFYKVDPSLELTYSATALDGVTAVITDHDGKKTWGVFTGNDGQDINANYTRVYDWSSKSEYSKIIFYAVDDQPDNVYYIKFVKPNGEWYNPRGDWHGNQGCMNVTGDGTGLFVGGITDKNGQDVANGALWEVTKTAEGYTLKNVGKGVYAVPGIGVVSEQEKAYISLYSGFITYNPELEGEYTRYIANNTVDGSDYWTIERPNGGNGPLLNNTAFEYWGGDATPRENASFNYYQIIDDLPAGKYVLSAEMYNSSNGEDGDHAPNGNAGLYIKCGETEEFVGVTEDGTTLKKYSTAEIVVNEGDVVTVGIKSKGYLSARWFVADNFELWSTGNNADQAAADAVVEKINAIGTVAYTEASKALIDAAREAYDALTEEQQALITEAQLKVLTDAEAAYANLKAAAENQAAATAVVETINAIGTVEYTEASKALIDAAREAYDALTEAQQALITEAQLKVLTDAEAAYANLKAAAENQAAATSVVETINAIGTVAYTEASKALIDAAREAYDALTEDQQALITEAQLKVLTDAEAAYAELEEAAKYATLTFAIAEQTGIGTQVKKGDVTLDITAEECWAVATLTVNNEDKLADLAEGKLTFNMQDDATVAVTYKWADEANLYTESDITSGIYSTKAGVKAYVKDGKIYVNANAAVRVYTTTGALIATKAPSAETAIFTVPAGTYIIKVGNEGIKVKVGE